MSAADLERDTATQELHDAELIEESTPTPDKGPSERVAAVHAAVDALASAVGERDQFARRITELETAADRAASERKRLEAEVRNLEETIDESRELSTALRTTLDTRSQELAAIEHRSREDRTALAGARSQIDTLVTELNELRVRAEQHNDADQRAVIRLAEVEQQLETRTHELEAQQRTGADLQATVDMLVAQRDKLWSEREEVTGPEVDRLQNELAEVRKLNELLENELSHSREPLAVMPAQPSEWEQEMRMARQIIENLEAQCARAEAKVAQTQRDLVLREAQLEDLSRRAGPAVARPSESGVHPFRAPNRSRPEPARLGRTRGSS